VGDSRDRRGERKKMCRDVRRCTMKSEKSRRKGANGADWVRLRSVGESKWAKGTAQKKGNMCARKRAKRNNAIDKKREKGGARK